jgi:hypothetical protein
MAAPLSSFHSMKLRADATKSKLLTEELPGEYVKDITVELTYLWTVMILLRLFQESKNIIFTCGDSKNHS